MVDIDQQIVVHISVHITCQPVAYLHIWINCRLPFDTQGTACLLVVTGHQLLKTWYTWNSAAHLLVHVDNNGSSLICYLSFDTHGQINCCPSFSTPGQTFFCPFIVHMGHTLFFSLYTWTSRPSHGAYKHQLSVPADYTYVTHLQIYMDKMITSLSHGVYEYII